jgi:uncharacterized protein YlxP (DUF503 family)
VVIGVLEIVLYLPESHSLKDKRQVVKSLKDKIRQRFNVAVAEVDALDLWQKAHLGILSLGNDRRQVNGRLDQVLNYIERLQPAVDLSSRMDLFDY